MANRPTAPIVTRNGFDAAPAQSLGALPHAVPPYLSTEQLAQLTPWSVQAINTMRKRGVFKVGVHYFQPTGRGGQVIFKWGAVVELIEDSASRGSAVVERVQPRRKRLNVEDATAAVQQLLD
jgi:hypothetical protein